MKGYIAVSLMIGIFAHCAFFSLLKEDIKAPAVTVYPGLQIITMEQYDYLKTLQKKMKDGLITAFPKTLSKARYIWSDTLNLIDDNIVEEIEVGLQEEDIPSDDDNKDFDFQSMRFPMEYILQVKQESCPELGEVFNEGLAYGAAVSMKENTIVLKNGVKMNSFIQGPVAERILNLGNIRADSINFEGNNANVKLRIWVAKNGNINQTIVEESSSLSLLDLEVVKMVKKWRFSDVYKNNGSNFEWGIVMIKLQK